MHVFGGSGVDAATHSHPQSPLGSLQPWTGSKGNEDALMFAGGKGGSCASGSGNLAEAASHEEGNADGKARGTRRGWEGRGWERSGLSGCAPGSSSVRWSLFQLLLGFAWDGGGSQNLGLVMQNPEESQANRDKLVIFLAQSHRTFPR